MEALLVIDNLQTVFTNSPLLSTQDFNGDPNAIKAVDNVSLSIARGETLALVGESGSGKSVTAHSVLRLLPEKARHPQGRILFEGEDLLQMSERRLRSVRGKAVSMIFQEPMTALNPLHKVERQIMECLDAAEFPSLGSKRARSLELLKIVKISDAQRQLNAYPHELSGGQRQRVMIAMAIANTPKLLIADEPTTALDVTVQAEILSLLVDIQHSSGMAILLITHDLQAVKHFADRVAVMQAGKIVEQAKTQQLFNNPCHHYTQALLATPASQLTAINDNATKIMQSKQVGVTYPLAKTLLKHFWTPPSISVLQGVSFTLLQGETLGIVGESGSGKSTLAKALLRLVPCHGDIILNETCISTMTESQFRPLRKSIQIVFQDPFASLNPRMNIADIIAEGLINDHSLTENEKQHRIDEVIARVGLSPDCKQRFAHEFSGGQRQRIAIARAVVMRPACIILDEPTSALDRQVQFQVLDLLQQLQRDLNIAYIFISHDLALVKQICHHVLVLKEGRQIEYGDTNTLFSAPKNTYTQRLINAALD